MQIVSVAAHENYRQAKSMRKSGFVIDTSTISCEIGNNKPGSAN